MNVNHHETCGICHVVGCEHITLLGAPLFEEAQQDPDTAHFMRAFLASSFGRRVFEKKHGTKERWNVCDCEECTTARAPLDQALAEERARREATPQWHQQEPSS